MKRSLVIWLSSMVAAILFGIVAASIPVSEFYITEKGDQCVSDEILVDSGGSSVSSGGAWALGSLTEPNASSYSTTNISCRTINSGGLGGGSLPSCNQSNLDQRQLCVVRNTALNFTAFRHFYSRNYYIYDLRRIRV